MDWSKAKNVLIVVFIALNIILLIKNYDMLTRKDYSSSGLIEDTKDVLVSRGIKLNCDIPSSDIENELVFERVDLDYDKIASDLLGKSITDISIGKTITYDNKKLTFNENGFVYIDGNNINNVDKTDNDRDKKNDMAENQKDSRILLEELLQSLDLPMEDFEIDRQFKIDEDVCVLEYSQIIDEFHIFDAYIKAKVVGNKVKELDYAYKKSSVRAKDSKQIILDAYQILLIMTDMNGEVIDSIDIGYKLDETNEDLKSAYEILSWRVRMGNSPPRFYSAFTGELIS